MKKIMFVILFGFYTQLIANDCFEIDGDIRCNNDVFEVSGFTVLLKVYNVGRGQVRPELYIFNYHTNSEEGLEGYPIYSEAPAYVYQQFKIGKVKKIYSNTPSGRKAMWQKIKTERVQRAKQQAEVIRSYIAQCEKGATKIAKGNREATELLTKYCFYFIKEYEYKDFFQMEDWEKQFPDLKEKLIF
ncbi:hypothetical protein [Helicobacter canis]|uniref:hypothetical protein n=1 Tax=Helicobacter canis TaxID=29419 RepID=UPI0026F1B87E|nr:hypothetical protein [Helicobacter canis]